SARGFSAPKGTPMAIIEKMSLVVKEALEDPDFKKKAEEAYQLIKYMSPAEYKHYLYELQETLKRLYEKSPW
ncbi:MAG TPA: tripartite tricarboxylate transporter substrate-binding protein, partial [Thermosynergistes sp.]|nr:tripartite tricarboxylate transporter substrate-binding protein [Thermosynergistes sp.]